MLSTLLTGRLLKSETLVSNLLHVVLVRDLSPFDRFSIDQCRQFAAGLRR